MENIEYNNIRTTEYRGHSMTMNDPYGFVTVQGLSGQFTSFWDAEKAVDASIAAKEAKKASEIPQVTKKQPAVLKIPSTDSRDQVTAKDK